jgi:hypothetical protein
MKSFNKGFAFSIICLLFATGVVNAQSISTFKTQFALPDSYEGVIISPSVEFEFNKHAWSIGPAFLLSYGDQIEDRDGFKLSGFYIGYDNYIHGKEEKFSLFHSFDFYLQHIKDEQASQYFDNSTNSFQAFNIEQVDKVVQLFANFGVLIKISEKLSLSQIVGLGANATFRSTTSPFNNFSDSFFAKDWLIKTGLSYRLK